MLSLPPTAAAHVETLKVTDARRVPDFLIRIGTVMERSIISGSLPRRVDRSERLVSKQIEFTRFITIDEFLSVVKRNA